MRVLVVHNRYRSALPSGENEVVDREVRLLAAAGVDVDAFTPSSDEIEAMPAARRVALAASPTVAPAALGRFADAVRRFRPDVVHVHNVYPLVSPAVVRRARRLGVPVVQTVHNYRHVCSPGTMYRDGHVCDDCVGRAVPWPGVVHRCYRGSAAQSAAMAVSQVVHRPTWRLVDRYLPVSRFVADHLVRTGVDPARVVVKPNAVDDPGPVPPPGRGFEFAGRLDREKGVLALLDAWAASGAGDRSVLTIAGDGPVREDVERRAASLPGVRCVGRVAPAAVGRLLADGAVAVVPSLWHETFGLVAVEAFARGRPVVATRMGGLGELVDERCGWPVAPTVEGLAAALAAAAAAPPDRLAAMGRNGRERYEAAFTPDAVVARLVDTYEAVVSERGRR